MARKKKRRKKRLKRRKRRIRRPKRKRTRKRAKRRRGRPRKRVKRARKRRIKRRKRRGRPRKRIRRIKKIKIPKRRGRKKKPKIRKRFRIKVKKPYPRRFLRNVSPENSLWIINGDIVKSIRELLKELKIMNDEAFRYHVNKERNDFSKWVKEIIGDRKLAVGLKKAKTRDKALKAVTNRIKQ